LRALFCQRSDFVVHQLRDAPCFFDRGAFFEMKSQQAIQTLQAIASGLSGK
jgi:hypothetical protein